MSELDALTLPVYDSSSEQEFLKGMTADNKLNTTIKLVAKLEDSLQVCRQISEHLNIECVELVPCELHAVAHVRDFLEKSATATCLRILNSKGAASLAANLRPSVETTLGWLTQNNIVVPHTVRERLELLLGKLSKEDDASSKRHA